MACYNTVRENKINVLTRYVVFGKTQLEFLTSVSSGGPVSGPVSSAIQVISEGSEDGMLVMRVSGSLFFLALAETADSSGKQIYTNEANPYYYLRFRELCDISNVYLETRTRAHLTA